MARWATHEASAGAASEHAVDDGESLRLAENDLLGTGYYDVYLLGSPLAALARLNPPVIANLDEIIAEIEWSDIVPSAQSFSLFDSRLMSVPADDDTWLMYYRTDLVAVPPATWDEYVATAARLNGTDMNGDGEPDYGACIDTDYLSHTLMTVAASTSVFTDGKRTGMVWDIQDDDHQHMKSLMTAEPWRLALRILERLAPFTPAAGGQEVPIDRAYSLWKTGRCAVAMTYPSFGALTNAEGAHIRGKLGASPPPGSAEVWDRETQTMVPCTAKLCRWALPHPTKGGGHLINRPALSSTPGKFVVNKRSSELQQALAFVSFATVNVDPRVAGGLNPFRRSHYDAAYFVAGGWDPSDASNYTAGLKDVTTRVQAVIPGIPTVASLQSTINEFAGRLIGLVQPDGSRAAPGSLDREALLVSMNAAVEQRFLEQGYSMTAVEAAHRRSLGLPQIQQLIEERMSRVLWIALAGIVLVASVSLLLVTVLGIKRLRLHLRVPRDGSKPFAVFFVAMKNESAVRDAYGAEVDSAVFPALRRLVARTAERHNCVAARHIDAHHMLVAKNPADALRCADAILVQVSNTVWPRPRQNETTGAVTVAIGDIEPAAKPPSVSRFNAVKSNVSSSFSRSPSPVSMSASPVAIDSPFRRSPGPFHGVTSENLHCVIRPCEPIAPLLSVGLEFAVGRIDVEHGDGVFFSGPPVSVAAVLADLALPGSVVMRPPTVTHLRRAGFLPERRPTDAEGETSRWIPRIGTFEAGPCVPVARLSTVQVSSASTIDTVAFWVVTSAVTEAERVSSLCHRSDMLSEGVESAPLFTGELAAALQQASGGFCTRHVAVYAVNVPVLRAVSRHRQSSVPDSPAIATAVAEILDEVASHAMAACVSASDGIFVFAINAVVPTTRATDRAITAANEAVDKLRARRIVVTAGVSMGAANAGDAAWYCPRRGKHIDLPTIQGRTSLEARMLALIGPGLCMPSNPSGAAGYRTAGGTVLCTPTVLRHAACCYFEILSVVAFPAFAGSTDADSPQQIRSSSTPPVMASSPAPKVSVTPVGRAALAEHTNGQEWMYQLQQTASSLPFGATNDRFTELLAEMSRLPAADDPGMLNGSLGADRLRDIVSDIRSRLGTQEPSAGAVSEALVGTAVIEMLRLQHGLPNIDAARRLVC